MNSAQQTADQAQKLIKFMGVRRLSAAVSIILVVISLLSLGTRGLNFGIDFTGGVLIEVSYSTPEPLSKIRELLANSGFEQATVVNFGADTDVLVRLPATYGTDVGKQIVALLENASDSEVDLRRVDIVGPQVGEELREQGGIALLLALAMVTIYIAMRFQLKFSIGAVTALIHDVIIVLGCFSITGWQFDLTVIAALLAVIGYSLNDTIVVSDRIRENLRKLRKQDTATVIDLSLTETLGRTMITSLTTALVLATLAAIGGDAIRSFSLALLIGVVVGTYSSIYIAANVLLALGLSKEDLMVPLADSSDHPIDDQP